MKAYKLKEKKGPVLLACEKCQRKVRKGGGELRKFGKAAKGAAGEAGGKVRVLDVPCLGLCPKGGVVVITPEQLVRGECSIVWEGAELEEVVRGLVGASPVAVGEATTTREESRLEDVQKHEQNDNQEQGAYAAGAVVAPRA